MSMWSITNHTPYAVGSTWGRSKDGVPEWIVAVKATFDILSDGEIVLADEQLPPLIAPEYNTPETLSSLRYDADLIGQKPTTDLILNGTAYAPNERPSIDFMVGMKVGPLQKMIRVRGDRRWDNSGMGCSASEPVTQVPLIYERAYGGCDFSNPDPRYQRFDSRNPAGCGVAEDPIRRVGQLLPNLEYCDGKLETAGPAGFGAIDSFWSPRRDFCGTYDTTWERERKPFLPNDWDPRSNLCSPADQRPTSYLRGGEVVELMNLTPDGNLTFRIPRAFIGFTTRIHKRKHDHRGQLSTIVIEPDHRRVLAVWLTSLACPMDVDYLEETVVRLKEILR